MRRALLLVLAGLLLLGGWLGARGFLAQRALTDARATLQEARTAVTEERFDDASAAVARADADTRRASRYTSDPAWRGLAALPWVGNPLRTTAAVARSAHDVTDAVLPGLLDALPSLQPSQVRRGDGSIDLALVERVTPPLRQSAAAATAALRRLQAAPTELLPLPVAEARDEFQAQLTELESGLSGAAAGAEIAPVLLGQDRLRRYLVLVQQTAESRGTGGLIGGYALVEARDGRVRSVEQGARGPRLDGPISVPKGTPADFVRRYEPFGAFYYGVNVNHSPDLPTVARLVEHRWTTYGGAPLDGVVVLDAKALALLLEGAGPVPVGGGRTVQPAELERFLAVEQYVGVPLSDQSGRKERLTAAAAAGVKRLEGGSREVLEGLVRAIRSGHLRMASDDPELGPALAAAGVDGALPRGDAPLAYPVVRNATGGKLDTFLERRVVYAAEGCEGRTRRSVIELSLRSDPPEGLPPYLTIDIDSDPPQSRTNRLVVSVYATRGAELQSATLDRRPLVVDRGAAGLALRPGTEGGLPVWDLLLELPPGEERVLRLELEEPTAPGAARVPEQPLAKDLSRDVRVPACQRGRD